MSRLARLSSSDGIGPLNWLSSSHSPSRLAKLPSSDGIGPLNWLLPRLSACRLAKLPSSDGIGPLNWLLPRLSSVTRPSASVLMPCHSPNGRLLSQLVSSCQLLPLVALYKAARAARSIFTSPALRVADEQARARAAVKKAAKAMMMMAVAGLLVMDMVVPRLAAKNGKGFCLSGGSLYHRSGIDHDAGFAQRALRKPLCAGTAAAAVIAVFVNHGWPAADYENRRKTSSGGPRI